jgi:hypothetical protein
VQHAAWHLVMAVFREETVHVQLHLEEIGVDLIIQWSAPTFQQVRIDFPKNIL